MDVIIEHAVLVAVFVEQAESVGIGKVFKLDEAIYSKSIGWRRGERKCMIVSPRQVPGRSQPAVGVGRYSMASSCGFFFFFWTAVWLLDS